MKIKVCSSCVVRTATAAATAAAAAAKTWLRESFRNTARKGPRIHPARLLSVYRLSDIFLPTYHVGLPWIWIHSILSALEGIKNVLLPNPYLLFLAWLFWIRFSSSFIDDVCSYVIRVRSSWIEKITSYTVVISLIIHPNRTVYICPTIFTFSRTCSLPFASRTYLLF